jgi:hypothetical protein
MVLKFVDIDKSVAEIVAKGVEAQNNPDMPDFAKLQARLLPIQAAFVRGYLEELNRGTDLQELVTAMGLSAGTALFNLVRNSEATDATPEGEDPTHLAMHQMIDLVSRAMHDAWNYDRGETPEGIVGDGNVDFNRKEVGDA